MKTIHLHIKSVSPVMDAAPTPLSNASILKTKTIGTKLGPMVAIGDDAFLYLLEFADRPGLAREVERLKQKTKLEIMSGSTRHIESIEKELNQYFDGELKEFKTPLFFFGSPFAKRVWDELQRIPFGATRSYAQIATAIGKPTAFRAVARANSANQIAIVIPCHRVINTNGELCGYSGGIMRKRWLINHEK